MPEACRGDFEGRIAAKVCDQLIELGRGVAIARANEIGIRENKIYGDANQRLVCGEQRNCVQLVFERPREIRGEEASAGNVLADVAREVVVPAPCDQAVPQDDMGR